MVDYVAATGTSGSLIIRDTGSTVYAIIKCTNPSTFANGVPWSIQVGAGSASGTFNISGNQEVVVWSGVVSGNAYVQLNMGSTGTSGLGGPASVGANIQRSTIPGAPNIQAWSNITPTSAQINFTGPASNGGAAIDYYLVRYGTSNPPENGAYTEFTTGTGANNRGGLQPDTTYYARVYAHNGNGYSAPSAVAAVTTLPSIWVRVGGVWKRAIPWVKVSGVWKRARPWVRVSGTWKRTK